MILIDVVPNFALGLLSICGYLLGETMADIVLVCISEHLGWNGIFIIVGAAIALWFLALILNKK